MRPPLPAGLSRRCFDVAKAYRLGRTRFARRDHDSPVVLVYQMGKVGSSTIVASLRDRAPHLGVFHVHYLTAEGLGDRESFYRNRYATLHRIPQHLIEGRHAHHLMQRRPEHRWKVVTLVRDPVSCNISKFFQTLGVHHPDLRMEHWEKPGWIDDLVRLFLTRHDHCMALEWLDRELREALQIDVYATPFRHARGYETYKSSAADLLLLRLEDLDGVGPRALADFLGLASSVTLSLANAAEAKPYAPSYRAFRSRLAMEAQYLEEMYASRLARHFYSVEERNAMRRRWREMATSTGESPP